LTASTPGGKRGGFALVLWRKEVHLVCAGAICIPPMSRFIIKGIFGIVFIVIALFQAAFGLLWLFSLPPIPAYFLKGLGIASVAFLCAIGQAWIGRSLIVKRHSTLGREIQVLFALYALGSTGLVVILLGYVFPPPVSYVLPESLQSMRMSQINEISVALRTYETDHGKLPEKLSQLVPDYVSTDKAWVFFPPVWNKPRENDIDKLRTRIDTGCIYAYGDKRLLSKSILAYELSGTWNDHSGKWYKGYRMVLYSDYSMITTSPDELKDLGVPY
jgi:hypothetical protein